eukprot:466842-Rhodomonas_salina.2
MLLPGEEDATVYLHMDDNQVSAYPPTPISTAHAYQHTCTSTDAAQAPKLISIPGQVLTWGVWAYCAPGPAVWAERDRAAYYPAHVELEPGCPKSGAERGVVPGGPW